MENAQDRRFLDPHDLAFRYRLGGGETPRHCHQAVLTTEFIRTQDGNYRFLALLGNDGDFDPALLDVKNGIGRLALRKYRLVLRVSRKSASGARLSEKVAYIELQMRLGCHARSFLFMTNSSQVKYIYNEFLLATRLRSPFYCEDLRWFCMDHART